MLLLPHFFIHWTRDSGLLEMRSIMTGNEIRFWTLYFSWLSNSTTHNSRSQIPRKCIFFTRVERILAQKFISDWRHRTILFRMHCKPAKSLSFSSLHLEPRRDDEIPVPLSLVLNRRRRNQWFCISSTIENLQFCSAPRREWLRVTFQNF